MSARLRDLAESAESAPPYLLLTGHDYRSRRRANFHFIADCLKARGPTRFVSLGFSWLSHLAGDPRRDLPVNEARISDGVECLLWRTPLHPFNPRRAWLQGAASRAFDLYARAPQPILDRWIRESRTVILESGLPVILFDRIRRLNPGAEIIYVASDDPETIGCAPHLATVLRRTAPLYDRVVLPSRALLPTLPPGIRACLVPHGIDAAALADPGPSPYRERLNAVSVGSMLFSRAAVAAAAAARPDIAFHVIGAGRAAAGLVAPNLRVQGEMRFADTLPYLAHADLGIAPYRPDGVTAYLADTSMKLMQYGHLGLPAICPEAAAGGRRGRFGYDESRPGTIADAVARALSFGRFPGERSLTWTDVTDRMLAPSRYADTRLDPQGARP